MLSNLRLDAPHSGVTALAQSHKRRATARASGASLCVRQSPQDGLP